MLAAVAQSVERVLGKDEVMGPNPISSSQKRPSGRWVKLVVNRLSLNRFSRGFFS
jgi:hypothetical protein